MTLVERDEALLALTSAYQACADGKGQLVILSGGVASGKTLLLQTFTEAVSQRGAVLLSATGSQSERSIRFGVLGQLISGLPLSGAVSTVLDRSIVGGPRAGEDACSEAARERSEAAGATVLRVPDARVLDEVCATVMELARKRPMVIAVDDVQLADDASRQALLYFQRRMRHVRVLLVLTERLWPDPTHEAFRAEVTRQLHTTHVRLSPLTREGVAATLAEELGRPTSPPLSLACHAVTGGNPLLVAALAEDQLSADAHDGPVAVGQEFRRAVVAFLHRCEPVVRDVVRGLAVLGALASRPMLGQLLDLPARSVAGVLESVEAMSLLDEDRFRHPVIRTVVLDTIATCHRAQLHLHTADLLYHNGDAPAADVAGHLAAADGLGAAVSAAPWVVSVLRYAAEEHLVADRLDVAAHLLDLAARVSGSESERASIAGILLSVEWRRKPSAAAPRVSALSRMVGADGRLDGETAVDLAKLLLWYGNTDELTVLLANIAESSSPDQHRSALAMRWLAFLCPPARPQLPPMSPAQGGAVPTDWSRAAAMLDRLEAGGSREEIWATAEHLLQSCELSEEALELQMASVAALLVTDRTDRAAYWCERLHAAAENRQVLTWRAVLGALHAELLLRQGEVVAAGRMARAAYELSSPLGWGVAIGLPLSVRILALTRQGQHDAASSLLRLPVPEAMFRTQFGLLYLHRRGLHHLATGRGRAASADFEQCAELISRWGVESSALVSFRAIAAYSTARGARGALVAVGSTRRPGAVERTVVPDGRRGVTESRIPGRALQVQHQFHGDPTQTVGTLSEAERRVAALAAGGYTNRQIGSKLYITVSTVEQHLTRVYRKLKVRRRNELPLDLLEQCLDGHDRERG